LDDITLHFYELPKWQKSNKFDINNPLDRWMHFFTNLSFYTMISLEERQMLDKIFSTVDLLDTTKHTHEQLRGYDLFIDNIMIRETDLDEAYKRGFAEGYAKGYAEGLAEGTNKRREFLLDEMILIMHDIKKTNLTIEQIAEKYSKSHEWLFRLKSMIS
jgi:hypothetical protein